MIVAQPRRKISSVASLRHRSVPVRLRCCGGSGLGLRRRLRVLSAAADGKGEARSLSGAQMKVRLLPRGREGGVANAARRLSRARVQLQHAWGEAAQGEGARVSKALQLEHDT